jgi:hypothetical protein
MSVVEDSFEYLDAPVERIAGADVPMPYAANLERMAVPQVHTDYSFAFIPSLHRDLWFFKSNGMSVSIAEITRLLCCGVSLLASTIYFTMHPVQLIIGVQP